MTKKDYKKFAEFWKDVELPDSEHMSGYQLQAMLVKRFADILATDNPRFDRERFYKACQINEII